MCDRLIISIKHEVVPGSESCGSGRSQVMACPCFSFPDPRYGTRLCFADAQFQSCQDRAVGARCCYASPSPKQTQAAQCSINSAAIRQFSSTQASSQFVASFQFNIQVAATRGIRGMEVLEPHASFASFGYSCMTHKAEQRSEVWSYASGLVPGKPASGQSGPRLSCLKAAATQWC